jgi:hypothetical protein
LAAAADADKPAQNHYIIVETNFKIYAYTTAPLQLKILGLFVRFDTKLPNMIAGVITKKSVGRALKARIKAMEIIQYLEEAAHPQVFLVLLFSYFVVWLDGRTMYYLSLCTFSYISPSDGVLVSFAPASLPLPHNSGSALLCLSFGCPNPGVANFSPCA